MNQPSPKITLNRIYELLNEAITEVIQEGRIQDPTHDEMYDYLFSQYGNEGKDEIEIAIYYFSEHFHSGQGSNLYSALSTSPYRPGPNSRMESEGEMVKMMYDDLDDKFAGGLGKKHMGESEAIPTSEFGVRPRMTEALSPKGLETIQAMITKYGDNRKVAVKLVDIVLGRMIGLTSSDLPDTHTFASGLDRIEVLLGKGKFQIAFDQAGVTARKMVKEEGGLDEGTEDQVAFTVVRNVNGKPVESPINLDNPLLAKVKRTLKTNDMALVAARMCDIWNSKLPKDYQLKLGRITKKDVEVTEATNSGYKITPKERNIIRKSMDKYPELKGNKKYDREGGKTLAVQLISRCLEEVGFQLDMVTGDMLIGEKGNRLLPYSKVSFEPNTEASPVGNSRINFAWENLSGGKFNPSYEIIAYVT